MGEGQVTQAGEISKHIEISYAGGPEKDLQPLQPGRGAQLLQALARKSSINTVDMFMGYDLAT
jgi:hypothetical protein